ncbi:hypothetical protein [Nonomuraea dietziae]|uniref:hypothetical protein n=1 Tax=Nonomuraea dietziae TaxID=65515 RepID=UPI0031CFFE2C
MVRQVGLRRRRSACTVNSLGACLVLLAARPGTARRRSSRGCRRRSASGPAGRLASSGRWALRPGPRPALLGSALVAAAGNDPARDRGASAVMAGGRRDCCYGLERGGAS